MNTENLRSIKKRPISDAVYFAGAFAHADSQQNISLFCSDFIGVLLSGSGSAKSVSRERSHLVPSDGGRVSFAHMLPWCYPLKVVSSIVGFISVFMVNQFGSVRIRKPTKSYEAMKKEMTAYLKVSIRSFLRQVRNCLFKNFPAPRNGVFAIGDFVFKTVIDICAQHGRHSLPENQGNCQRV